MINANGADLPSASSDNSDLVGPSSSPRIHLRRRPSAPPSPPFRTTVTIRLGELEMMMCLRRISPMGGRNPNLRDTVRAFSTDPSSLRNSIASILDSLSLKPGGTLVHNCGDGDAGKTLIQLAKERKLQTISIIEDKPGNPETIEELKALGGDIVVPESYTKTWYMKRLVNELTPSAGINFGEGYQVTAVGKAVAEGGTLVSFGKNIPKDVLYDGAGRKPISWDTFAKEKKLKVVNM